MFNTTEEKYRRITINHSRKALGEQCSLTDAELEQVLDQLYALAEVTVDAYLEMNDDRLDAESEGTSSADLEYEHDEPEAVRASYNEETQPEYSALGFGATA